jgi:hypothetical protein
MNKNNVLSLDCDGYDRNSNGNCQASDGVLQWKYVSLHYVSRNEKTYNMKRKIYYSSAYESQEVQFGHGNCRTYVFVNRFYFFLLHGSSLVNWPNFSVCALLSSLVSEHLLSYGIL